eukprot:gnl/TRDRNA2_/TRDRNA2_85183_c0_seq2.p1 gnl/TRDRNA2_/TRDRNA2_85183_c0~~gnl/TRDRNA2_/TRDRNA2_85183_c0_seq2.p1  ORF type:complete len:241 (-),score=58.78 gnl/TRDRNA2_/TRDRNA2_85183_c0_seq2:384-1052(-)
MVLVRGLDRLEGTALEGMSDELWSEHTAELQVRFEAQQDQPGALGFTEFCEQFAELGGLTTGALVRHQEKRNQMRLAAERRAASQLAAAEHRAQQAAGRQQEAAATGGADGGRSFPAHWGEPPAVQTEDVRPLPGGFGEGSSTLAAWIEKKMALDAAAAVPGKQSWPELVGTAGEAAVATIRAERPDLAEVLTVPEDAMVTMDWREDRVRVFVDGSGNTIHD